MTVHFALFVFVFAMAYSATSAHRGAGLSGTADLIVRFFEWFGNLSMFCSRLVRAAFAPPYEVREFVHQFDELGSKSLPLVALAGAVTGVVLTLSTRLLTEARAKVVRDYLAQNFKLDDKRVKTIGLGKTKEEDESSKLVILVYPSKPPAGQSPHSSPSSQ